jgi:DNA integrity scanning protein DisA with diadenylate cyclase activity
MAYVAGMASFVPYMTKQTALRSKTLLLLNFVVYADDLHRLLTYPVSISLGFSTGAILSSLIFSFQPAYWIIGGLIAMTHSCALTFIIRQEIRRSYEKLMRESQYKEDENFTL